jgi:hypothetical protein
MICSAKSSLCSFFSISYFVVSRRATQDALKASAASRRCFIIERYYSDILYDTSYS